MKEFLEAAKKVTSRGSIELFNAGRECGDVVFSMEFVFSHSGILDLYFVLDSHGPIRVPYFDDSGLSIFEWCMAKKEEIEKEMDADMLFFDGRYHLSHHAEQPDHYYGDHVVFWKDNLDVRYVEIDAKYEPEDDAEFSIFEKRVLDAFNADRTVLPRIVK